MMPVLLSLCAASPDFSDSRVVISDSQQLRAAPVIVTGELTSIGLTRETEKTPEFLASLASEEDVLRIREARPWGFRLLTVTVSDVLRDTTETVKAGAVISVYYEEESTPSHQAEGSQVMLFLDPYVDPVGGKPPPFSSRESSFVASVGNEQWALLLREEGACGGALVGVASRGVRYFEGFEDDTASTTEDHRALPSDASRDAKGILVSAPLARREDGCRGVVGWLSVVERVRTVVRMDEARQRRETEQ